MPREISVRQRSGTGAGVGDSHLSTGDDQPIDDRCGLAVDHHATTLADGDVVVDVRAACLACYGDANPERAGEAIVSDQWHGLFVHLKTDLATVDVVVDHLCCSI